MPDSQPAAARQPLRRAFDRVAPEFADSDFLYREMAGRMDERLDMLRITPARMLDAGCGLGRDRLALHKRYPDAFWLGLDQSVGMLAQGRLREPATPSGLQRLLRRRQTVPGGRLAARMTALPLVRGSVDLVWSNAALHWLDDLPAAFQEFQRVLGLGGLLMFSLFGPDTLRELRQAMAAIPGAASRIRPFTDMHDVGDMLLHAGLSDPVMDMETLVLTYADPWQALRELQRAGASAGAMAGPGLTGRHFWRRVFEHWPRDAEGRYRLTFELVQGHAWKMADRQPGAGAISPDGRVVIQFMPQRRG